ncbi:MAG: terminase large subunit [Anaerolineae bacterium]
MAEILRARANLQLPGMPDAGGSVYAAPTVPVRPLPPGARFDETKAQRAIEFFQLLKHVDGQYYDQPFVLLPWQRQIIRDVYGTVRPDGTRWYRYVYLSTAKKNGKSEIDAGAALYHTFADGEKNGEIYGCAGDRKQASIVFQTALKMVEMVPALKKRAKIKESTKEIVDKTSGSVYTAVSSEAYSKHGFKVSACVFDELHDQPNRELWDVMTYGSGASRLQPIWWVTTTAGDDPDRQSIGWEVHEKALQIMSGDVIDPTWYVVVYSYEGDDIYNESNWYAANPSLGVSKSLDTMRENAATAKYMPSQEKLFRWLDLNQWVTTKLSSWLPLELFDQTVGGWSLAEQKGKDCFLGQDMSTTTDLSSLCALWPPQGAQRDWRCAWWSWIPKESMVERIQEDHLDYARYEAAGWVNTTEGNTIDHWAILEWVKQLAQEYRIIELVGDPAFATMLLQAEMKAGINVVTLQGTFANLTDPINQVETLARSGQLTHERNLLARWTWGNASLATNGSGLRKLVKEHKGKSVVRTKRIDPIMALVLAMGRARFYESKVDLGEAVRSKEFGF